MSVTYLGSVTVLDVLGPLGLGPLFAAVTASYDAIRVQLSALVSFKASIRILAIADLEAQLKASLDAQISLSASIVDPTAYLAGLLSALVQVQANINLLVPAIAIGAQLSASLAISAELSAKIAAFDLALSAIASINASISAAISVSLPALPTAPGVYAFQFDGAASDLGTEVDAAVAANTPIVGATSITSTILVITTSNVAAVLGRNAILVHA